MIQVNRKIQHYRIYTLIIYIRTREIILYAHEKTEKDKDKDNNQRQMKD